MQGTWEAAKKKKSKVFFALLADGAISHDGSLQLSLINNYEGEIDLDMREKCGEKSFCERTVVVLIIVRGKFMLLLLQTNTMQKNNPEVKCRQCGFSKIHHLWAT